MLRLFSHKKEEDFLQKIFTVNAATSVELTDNSGQSLVQGNMYKVQLVTSPTTTRTGAEYLVWYSSTAAVWQLRAVSMAGAGSNHPLLILDYNIVKISMLHTTNYYVKAFVEEINSNETDALPYVWSILSVAKRAC